MRKPSKFFLSAYGILGFAFTFLVGVLCFLFIPNSYLTPFLLGWINDQGWGTFDVKYISLHPRHVHLKDVKYTPDPQIPALTTGEVDISIYWDQFVPKFQSVTLKNLKISKNVIENMMESPSSSPIRAPTLTFENAVLYSEEISFPFNVIFNGTFVPGISFDGHLIFKFSKGEFQGKLTSTLSMSSIKAYVTDLSAKFKGWDHVPLLGQGELIFEDSVLKAKLSSKSPALKLDGQCSYAIVDQSGGCSLTYSSKMLERVIPKGWLESYAIDNFSGELEGATQLIIKDGLVKPITGKATIAHVSFNHPYVHVQSIKTSVQYAFDKELSFPQQILNVSADKVNVGVPLSHIQFALQWDGRNRYYLQEGSASLEGGSVNTKDLSLTLPFQRIDFPLEFKGIPAQFFVTLSQVPSLDVSGHVAGHLNMQLSATDYGVGAGSTLYIQDPPGTIQYRSGTEPKQILSLKGNESPMDLVFLALWNFQYEKLSLDLEKPLQGQLQATLHLNGKNPQLLNGQPFEFNIKATGQLKELIENVFYSITKS
ncbi:MAG: YdbH domain-containing protein [Proteobacteria bacterium]|nr:YdbH domain-containing protein [Pseudomonadota bacterium]